MRRLLRIFFCGEGIALAAAIEFARQRGHEVIAIMATAPDEAAVMRRSGLRVADPGVSVAAFAAGLEFDVLLSINNGRLLDATTIRRARLAAINYHNAPLPAYAGLRATAWAVFNGEGQHGITWHLIEPGIDTGNILLQRRVTLSAEETTARLNARCTEATVETLEELFSLIETGPLSGTPQDFAHRTYYRRSDTAPGGAIIDWRWHGSRILRMVRACDWGGVANDFGTATIMRSHGPPCYALRASFEPVESSQQPVPGTVLGRTGDEIQVACADGVVTLAVDRAGDLAPDEVLPTFDATAMDRLAAIHRAAIAAEPRWLAALHRLARKSPESFEVPRMAAATEEGCARLLEAVDRVLGGNAVVAVRTPARSPLLLDWYAMRARDALTFDAPPPLRDVALRQPGLGTLGNGWDRSDFRIDVLAEHAHAECLEPAPEVNDAHAEARPSLVLNAVKRAATELAAEPRTSVPCSEPALLQMLRVRATEAPDAPAVEDLDRCWTRGELMERASALAGRLIAAKLRRRAGVGILLPRGADYVVASLAAMLAGGAYVPLNLESPDKRRYLEIAEAGITHLVTDRAGAASVPVLDVEVLLIAAPHGDDGADALPCVSPDDSAYRIFTSGSTGRPKAVDVSHSAVANLIAHYGARLALGAADRMTFLSHPTFDAAVADIWPVLCAGGTLLISPPHLLLDPVGLVQWLRATRASLSFVPTAVGQRLLDLSWPRDLALRALLVGGDKLHHRPAHRLPFELINTYGPTENTVDSLWAVIEPGEGAPPIGRPILGVRAEVVDPSGAPLPSGAIGELVLSGRQLARGYFGRPDLTAQRFDHDANGSRRYRTGDLARLNDAGEFEFLGRIDHQVQMRGIRIEPGEIEAILHTDPRVREAVCVPEQVGEEVSGLVVHVVAASGEPPRAADLKALLEAHLVPTMVPGTIVMHDTLPRTAAGKTDRAALARQTARTPTAPGAEAGDLNRLWREALPLATDGDPGRSFWELGGTSLGVMKLLLAVQAATGAHVPVAKFLSSPTLNGLRALAAQCPATTVVELRAGVGTPLIFWYSLSGDLEQYRYLIDQDLGGRPVLGVLSPLAVPGGQLPATLEEAARAGLAALKAHGVAGGPAMLGYSWGGLLAFEAARQLALSGTPASFLGMIGTHPPLVDRGRLTRTLHFIRWMPLSVFRKWKRGDRTFRLLPMLRRLAGLVGAGGTIPPPIVWPTPRFDPHVQLGYRYRPRGLLPIDVFLVRDLDTKDLIDHYGYIRFDKPDFGWARWTSGQVTVKWLPGDHMSIALGTQAQPFAALLRAAVAQADTVRVMQDARSAADAAPAL